MVLVFPPIRIDLNRCFEVQLAVDSHLHILQFRIEDVPASDDLKYFLGTPRGSTR